MALTSARAPPEPETVKAAKAAEEEAAATTPAAGEELAKARDSMARAATHGLVLGAVASSANSRRLTGAESLTNRLETYKRRKTDELRPVKEENRRSEGENWIGSWRDGMNSRGYPKLSIKGCYNWFTGALLPDFLFASIPVRCCASPSQSGPRFE